MGPSDVRAGEAGAAAVVSGGVVRRAGLFGRLDRASRVVEVSAPAGSGKTVLLRSWIATDYALLLTARYREELRRHEDRHEAMPIALRRADPAIIASAATVIASLLTLSAAELNSTKDMGPVLAIGVAVALVAMLTLLPALLVICGRWVFWPTRPAYGSADTTSS